MFKSRPPGSLLVVKESMLTKRELQGAINELIAPEGLQIYSMELPSGKQGVLRIFICKTGGDVSGIKHDECAAVARRINREPGLEWLLERYSLEVSSPGINRKLSSAEHFENAIGERIRLTVDADEPTDRKVVIGELLAVEGDALKVKPEGQPDVEPLAIPIPRVVKARVDFLFE